jgi:hypothetical protein
LLLLWYAGLVGAAIVSTMTTLFAYLFSISCEQYSVLIDDSLHKAHAYLEEAKGYLHRADNATLVFLNRYNAWMNLQASFRESAMHQLEAAAPTTYIATQPSWAPRAFGRRLYDPRAAIASGRSVLATLNQTISHDFPRGGPGGVLRRATGGVRGLLPRLRGAVRRAVHGDRRDPPAAPVALGGVRRPLQVLHGVALRAPLAGEPGLRVNMIRILYGTVTNDE